MSWPFAAAIYFIFWWLALLAVLPFGVRTQGEDGLVVPGTPGSAPAAPRLLRIGLMTTAIAAIAFVPVYLALSTAGGRALIGYLFDRIGPSF